MKYTLFIFFTFLISYNNSETNVFICGPKGAKRYHYNENCRGLTSCNHGIVKTSLKQAQGLGLTLCGWED